MRYARIQSTDAIVISRYLPTNYSVLFSDERTTVIAGEDVYGWALDDFVLPRLSTWNLIGGEIDLLGECKLCGEAVFTDDDPGEMHDPNSDKRGTCHGQCGLDAGWVVS
jgi:hypothetical protein